MSLNLSLHSPVIDSAHCLTEMNIMKILPEVGDMEQTGNSRVNLMTMNCDLESAWVLHIVSLK